MQVQVWRRAFVARLVIAAGLAGLLLAPAASAGELASGKAQLAGLPERARTALSRGDVVVLENVADGTDVRTRLVAVVPVGAGAVVDEIRDYEELPRIFPEVRTLSVARGEGTDTFEVEVKPHAMLPTMSLTKQVSWQLSDGGAEVDVRLVRSSSPRVKDQTAAWRVLRLSDSSSLVVYESLSSYDRLPFRNRVMSRLQEACERLVNHVRDQCVLRARPS